MSVPLSDVVFAFDFSRIEVIGGVRYLWDYGPNGFHFAFPGGAADPTPTTSGDLSFDGGDYLSLPAARLAEFYQKMPTGECTMLYSTTLTTAGRTIFSCHSPGANIRGMAFASATAAIYEWYQWRNTAANPAIQPTGHALSRAHSCALTMKATPRFLRDQAIGTAAWAGGAFGTCVYDPAIVPRIGSVPAGGAYFIGVMRYLALLKTAIPSADLAFYSRLLAEGTKPWCVR